MKHVQQVRGRWVARLTVPEELRAIIGQRELVEVLPAEPKARERRALAVLNSFHARLDEARELLNARRPTLSTVAKAHYRAELVADDRERRVRQDDDEFMRLSRATYASRLRLLIAGELSASEAESLIGYAIEDLAAKGLALALPRDELRRALAETQLEALARFEERDAGQVKLSPPESPLLTAPDPVPADATPAPATGMKLSDVLTAFHQERTAGGNSLAAKTMEEHKAAVRMFSEHMGSDTPVKAITKKDVIAFKQALLATPTRYTLRFRGLTLPQAIKANAKRPDPYPTLDPQTINMKWRSHVSSILGWASSNDFIDMNPAQGIRVDTGKAAHRERSRKPFDRAELKRIFGDRIFADLKRYGTRQWALLLALYTGARSSSEIARIRLADIQTEQDVLTFHLSGASKNQHSKRFVPVHGDLVKLGLLDHVQRLKERGETRLFPDWEPEDKVNRWFLRTFLPSLGITDDSKVFHSFRHNLKTELVRTGCPKELHDLITGHKDQSVAAVYMHDVPLKLMAAALDKVAFELPMLSGRSTT